MTLPLDFPAIKRPKMTLTQDMPTIARFPASIFRDDHPVLALVWGKPCTEQLSEAQTVACLEQMKILADRHKKTVAQVTRPAWHGAFHGVT